MNSREVIDNLLRREKSERMGVYDSPWGETLTRWINEGFPVNQENNPVDWFDHLGLDMCPVGQWFDNLPLRGVVEIIEETISTCDYVAAKRRSSKRIMVCFDEWNVWDQSDRSLFADANWSEAPHLLEQVYTMEDTLVFAGMAISLLNHADRVKIACLAQTVNAIAPILTRTGGGAWRQPTFYPFMHVSNMGRGVVLRQIVSSDTYDTSDRSQVPYLKCASVHDPESGALTIFAVNRSQDTPMELKVGMTSFGKLAPPQWIVMHHDDLAAVNTEDNPDNVQPAHSDGATLEGGALTALLAPLSWNVFRMRILHE